MTKDPVCGKEVDPLRARAVGIYGGVTYYFCSQDCKGKFVDPRKTPRDETARDEKDRPLFRKGAAPKAPPAKAPVAAPAGGEPEPRKPEAHKPEPEPADSGADSVKYARSKPRREPDHDSSSVKVDSTPSMEAELEAAKSGGGRAWILVVLLFAIAGVVLFFALKK
jgi:YHS domain-containing protein